MVERLTWREELPVEELVRQLEDVDPKPDWLEEIKAGVVQLRRTLGKRHWSCAEFQELADRKVAIHRAYAPQQRGGTRATSIHGAKNREFGTVVLLWGAGVQGTDEYKRRLLYNAITRGRESCTVLVQTERLLHSPRLLEAL